MTNNKTIRDDPQMTLGANQTRMKKTIRKTFDRDGSFRDDPDDWRAKRLKPNPDEVSK